MNITCTGCKQSLPPGEFEVTTCRGKPLRRKKCRECMRAYYRSVKPTVKRQSEATYHVSESGGEYLLIRKLNGCKSRLISTHLTEQEADRAAAARLAALKE